MSSNITRPSRPKLSLPFGGRASAAVAGSATLSTRELQHIVAGMVG
jgi:hypothetical protein